MQDIIEKIVKELEKAQATVAVAESCTGGMVSASLVDYPGVSACFKEGYVTYSNEAKEKNLGVLHTTLEAYGAVSRQTAEQMAEGVRKRLEPLTDLPPQASQDRMVGQRTSRSDWYILRAPAARKHLSKNVIFPVAGNACAGRRQKWSCNYYLHVSRS